MRTDPDAPKHRGITLADPADGPARHRGAADRHGARARPSSARCSSTTCGCRSPIESAPRTTAGASRNVTFAFERGTAFVSELVDAHAAWPRTRAGSCATRRTGASSATCVAELDALWALTKRNVTQAARDGVARCRRADDEARLLGGPPAARRAVAAGARPRARSTSTTSSSRSGSARSR